MASRVGGGGLANRPVAFEREIKCQRNARYFTRNVIGQRREITIKQRDIVMPVGGGGTPLEIQTNRKKKTARFAAFRTPSRKRIGNRQTRAAVTWRQGRRTRRNVYDSSENIVIRSYGPGNAGDLLLPNENTTKESVNNIPWRRVDRDIFTVQNITRYDTHTHTHDIID